VLTAGAVALALYTSESLVTLWLLGSAGVAQLFPGVVLGLFSKRVTPSGVFAGLGVGIALVAILMLTGRDPWHGFAPGFVALGCNFAVTGVVSLLTKGSAPAFEETASVVAASQSGI
jgi:solute:Na+ symporter, SSS family